MKRNFARAVFILVLAVGARTSLALTTNSSGFVQYQAFNNQLYVLKPWFGKNIVVLNATNAVVNSNVMSQIVASLDHAWDFYVLATGQYPIPYDPTTLFGKDTIAVVSSTCGAGCSYVGFTGTEILSQYFSTLYNGVARSKQYDQVLFYEFGRNFWSYGPQLQYHSPDVDPVVTGFAVYMRFLSMDAAGVAGGPFNGVSFTAFRMAVTNLIDSYISLPVLNWTNTFRISQAPPNALGLGGTDLIASLLMRIGRDFGRGFGSDSFGYHFWKQAALRPGTANTLGAVDNFILAACATVNTNLTRAFATTWKFPVSANARLEAQQRWGDPFVILPTIVALNDGGTNIVLRWTTEWNNQYQVQVSPDMQTWTNLGAPLTGNGSLRTFTVPAPYSPQQFFRLRLL
jgi:hypothetical protein